MIYYKYFHHPDRGYVDELSKSEELEYNEQLEIEEIYQELRTLKSKKGEKNFSYILYNSKCFLLQDAGTNQNFYCGFCGDEKEFDHYFPINYSGKLEDNYFTNDLQDLKKIEIPKQDNLSSDALANIQPAWLLFMLDKLLYDYKPLLICGSTADVIEDYIKSLFLLIPREYAIKVGFTLNVEQIIIPKKGTILESIRIVGTKKSVSGYENFFNICDLSQKAPIIFNPGKYTQIFMAKPVQNMLETGKTDFLSLVPRLKEFFINGKMNEQLLEEQAPILIFEIEKTSITARGVLDTKKKNSKMDISDSILCEALKILLQENQIYLAELDFISQMITKSKTLTSKIQKEFNELKSHLLLTKILDLSNDERSFLIGRIVEEEVENKNSNESILNKILNFPKELSVFDLILDAYKECHTNKLFYIVLNYFESIQINDFLVFNKRFFKFYYAQKDLEAISIFMLSGYNSNSKEMCRERILTLLSFFKDEDIPSKNILLDFSEIVSKMKTLNELVSLKYEFLSENFVYDFLEKNILTITFEDILEICTYKIVKEYTTLLTIIKNYLLDERYVLGHINLKNIVQYKEIINQSTIDSNLLKKVEEFEMKEKSEKELIEFRMNFIIENYNFLTDIEKTLLVKKKFKEIDNIMDIDFVLNDKSYEGNIFTRQKETARKIDKYLDKDNDPNLSSKGTSIIYIIYFSVLGFIFTELSYFILLLPIFFKNWILNKPFIKELQNYPLMSVFSISILVWIVFFFNYLIRAKMSNYDRKKSLSKSVSNIFQFFILPILFFSIGLIVIYFTR